jgi:phage terminase large subunit-like protein
MTLQQNGRLGSQRPLLRSVPPRASSAGVEAVEQAEAAGLHLDPWQKLGVEDVLGENADGTWAATETGVIVPRQNGKGGIIEATELFGLFIGGEKLILHSAHEFKTAQEAFQRVLALVTNTDDLRKKVHKVTNAHGEEGIQLKSGQRLRFVARSSGSGRGFTADRIILDEAYALTSAQMAALMPTLSARPNTQINYYSTPPADEAAFLCGLRARGKAGDPGLAYLDWGAELNMLSPSLAEQIADPDLWYATNPALGIRISETAIIRELSALPPEEFARERLGVWPASSAGSVIDPEQWGRLADVDSAIDGAMALAVDITPSRDYSCIAAYGLRSDGTGHMEIIEHLPGTDWVIRRLNALRERWKPVAIAIDSKGPAGSLLTELEKQGYAKPEDAEDPAYGDLLIPTAAEVAASCGQLIDAVTQATVRHIDQSRLNTAVVGAKSRPLGEAWGWGRKVSGTDISPLVAVTLARYAWESRAHLVEDRDYDLMDSIGF